MLFRFTAVVALLIALAIAGVAIEKQNLSLRRAISLQDYRRQQLVQQRSRLRLRIEQLSVSAAVSETVDAQPLPRRTR